MNARLAGCLVGSSLALAWTLEAGTLRIPTDAPDLATALVLAGPSDEIVLADGVWSGAGFTNLEVSTGTFTLRSASGDPSRCVVDLAFAGRLLLLVGDASLDVAGITVRHGLVSPAYDYLPSNGAAFWVRENARLNARDCRFEFNRASYGAAIDINDFAQVTVDGCRFTHNEAEYTGGAIGIGSEDVTVGVVVKRSDFVGNLATLGGGAIGSYHAALDISASRFVRNQSFANNYYFGGGAMFAVGGRVRLKGCAFVNNASERDGGALLLQVGFGGEPMDVEADNLLLVGNQADWQGAAIRLKSARGSGSYVRLRGLTLHGNRRFEGFDRWGNPLRNHTITDQKHSFPEDDLLLTDSILADGPQSVRGFYLDVQRCLLTEENTLRLRRGEAVDTLVADPLFVGPGGWLDLGVPDDRTDDVWLQGDYRLMPGSPAIDPAFGLVADGLPSGRDLDGNARYWDGDGDGTVALDLGAYEHGARGVGDLNCDGRVDYFDIDPFVLVVTGQGAAYAGVYPHCRWELADVNGDGAVDFFDIDGFVAAVLE